MRQDLITISGFPSAWKMRALVKAALRALRTERLIPPRRMAVLSVSGAGIAAMARLNRRFRGMRGPTDVLSFEQAGRRGGRRAPAFLGDLVVCVPITRRQARALGHGVRVEAAVLIVHGLLHLLGFDHERSRPEAARMARTEAGLLHRMRVKTGTGLIGRGHGK